MLSLWDGGVGAARLVPGPPPGKLPVFEFSMGRHSTGHKQTNGVAWSIFFGLFFFPLFFFIVILLLLIVDRQAFATR
jgi:hypothetical protein